MTHSCIKCGKYLSDPVSIERHMGPTCFASGIHSKDPGAEDPDKMDHIDISLSDGIILERRDGKVATNVPWTAVKGSPDGFEWGYGGSGPCDLALNILEVTLRTLQYRGHRSKMFKGSAYNLAYHHRVKFCHEFLVDIPKEGGVIDFRRVKKWAIDKIVEEAREDRHEY